MIVQCEACQTRFRLADEKVKPGGTKVRCSKCKEIFTVMPPEPEPEPVEETVDFSAMNMEKVEDEAPATESPAAEETATPEPDEQPEPSPEQESQAAEAEASIGETAVDFSALEAQIGENVDMGDELADEFSFADTSQAAEATSEDGDIPAAASSTGEEPVSEQPDFGAAFEESEEPGAGLEFDFSEDAAADETADAGDIPDFAEESATADDIPDFSGEVPAETEDFSFDSVTEEPTDEGPAEFALDSSEEEPSPQEEPGEFSFGDNGDSDFSFDSDAEPEPAAEESGDFSFDEENPFGDEPSADWSDEGAGDDSFDFDEPQFDSESAGGTGAEPSSEEGGLQFGEIDFAGGDDAEASGPGFEEEDFSQASLEQKEEPEPFAPERERTAPPPRDDDDDDILPPPPPRKKKSSLSRVLTLLVLLLVILGGAAGFLFVQEGTLDVNTITRYLPFLKDYLGEAQETKPVERIGINILGSSYVNGQAGQMLVIQGSAVNNYPASRSAITVKGVLLDNSGKVLMQQTVFCGNRLDDAALQNLPYPKIEEAMNNQFGDSLSNMNIAAGGSIPFTIVFRNIPDGVANINVEVVESKPGAG